MFDKFSFQGVSKVSFAAVLGNLELQASSVDLSVADDFFSVARFLRSSGGLGKKFSDERYSLEVKQRVVSALFAKKVSGIVLETLKNIVVAVWLKPQDMLHAVECVGVSVVLAVAQKRNVLESLAEELFYCRSFLLANYQVQHVLDDAFVQRSKVREMVLALFGKRVSVEALCLLMYAVDVSSVRIDEVLDGLAKIVVAKRSCLLAQVQTFQKLSVGQCDVLRKVLGALYGRKIHLHVEVLSSLLGGVRVQVGDEVIDGTVLGRLRGLRNCFTV